MEKLYFDNETFIWKKKLNLTSHKDELLTSSYDIINAELNNTTGGYSYKTIWDDDTNKVLDTVLQIGVNECKILAMKNDIKYNHINFYSWINVVLSKNPIQTSFKYKEDTGIRKYHSHTEINASLNSFYPHYTFVYYIQMPDTMNDDDGALYFLNTNGNEYWIKPEEDDLIVMPGYMPHSPNNAPNSNTNRIVIAGNVGFDFVKNEKSII